MGAAEVVVAASGSWTGAGLRAALPLAERCGAGPVRLRLRSGSAPAPPGQSGLRSGFPESSRGL